MEQTETIENQPDNIIDTKSFIKQPSFTRKKLLLALVVVFVLATIFVVGMGYGVKKNSTVDVVNNPIKTVTDDMEDWKVFTDQNNIYKFSYPSTWEILATVPMAFQSKPYIEGGDINIWLSGKMFSGKCSGPILQNRENKDVIIAFEILSPERTDGSFCWSTGSFDDKKWNVGQYVYPLGSDNLIEPEWKGDYLISKYIDPIDLGYSAVAVLVNRETYTLIEEKSFDQILSTFKFIDTNSQTSTNFTTTGYIQDIVNYVGGMYLNLDEAKILKGEEAIQTAIQETGCTREKINYGDCAPSLNNGFYISNPDSLVRSLRMSTDAVITTNGYSNTADIDKVPVTFDNFREVYVKGLLYSIKIENGQVTEISEVYVP